MAFVADFFILPLREGGEVKKNVIDVEGGGSKLNLTYTNNLKKQQ